MTVKMMFHLGISKNMLKGATLAIMPGDPARVEKIASHMQDPVFLNSHREFTLYLAYIENHPVVVCSTGIGGPSTSIAIEELAQLGVKTFLRVGTTGAIQPHINIGDMVISTGAVRLDGASQHFAPLEFPAVADFDVVYALKTAAQRMGATVHLGVTASSDTFYPGQERYDTSTKRVVRRFQNSLKEWQQMGVMNYEMESATMFTQCASSGLRSGCVAGVLINRNNLKEIPDQAVVAQAENGAVKIVVEAARFLLAEI